MLCKQGQHVVEKRNACSDGTFSGSINLQFHGNARLFCCALNVCASNSHTAEFKQPVRERQSPILGFASYRLPCNLLRMKQANRLLPACLALVTISLHAVSGFAAPAAVYRMSQLEEAKKRAAAEHKPIAWISTFTTNLAPHPKPLGKGSHAATAYAIRALQNDAILIYS